MFRKLICLFVIVLCFGETTAESETQFGTISLILGSEETGFHLFTDVLISPNGKFILAHTLPAQNQSQPIDLFQIPAEPYLLPIDALETISAINQFQAQNWDWISPYSYYFPPMAFSSTSEYVAVRLDDELQIRNFPSLDIAASLPIDSQISPATDEILHAGEYHPEAVGFPRWSPNNQLVALAVGDTLVVWDWEQNSTVTHHISEQDRGQVQVTSEGWFIDYTYSNGFRRNTGSFELCSFTLEICTVQNTGYRGTATIASEDGATVLVYPIEQPEVGLQIMSRTLDGTYEYSQTIPNAGYPINFSPAGMYFLARHKTNFETMQIWRVSGLTLAQTIAVASQRWISWLPDGEHFLTLNRETLELRLYQVSQDEPLDTVNLGSVATIENRDQLINEEQLSISDVSADGRRVLVNLGWALVVVEIEYA